ncbi:radical SAM protein [Runella sp.]|uniref:B12-binding domain-containing radical SAM protein n=1 Tax=Runella sp. TaxID=1960881 RepID=UPI00263895C9|nr:radical SAM protein [Runella sp.]
MPDSKKILFTHSYFYRLDPKQWKAQQPYPPYNTILAASMMEKEGFEVALFDSNLKRSPLEIEPYLQKEQPTYLVIYDDSFNYLSKMCLTAMRYACFEMIQLGKQYGCVVIVSSSDATDHFDKYLDAGADFVLLGEAELTLKELIKSSEQKLSFETIDGMVFRVNDETVKTKKRTILTSLDLLPMPAWDLVKIGDYQQIWQKRHGYFSLNIATTRGCPYKCNWCAKPIYGNRYNSRSPQKVADEIAFLMKTYQVNHFWICDDIFGLKPGWVKQFKASLEEKKVKPKLKIQSRADLLLKEDTIQDLVEVGLDEVWMGAESGSQKILDAMDKGITTLEIEKSTQLLKQKGVKVAFFLQYGYLGEHWEDIEKTLSMVKQLLPSDLGISVSYPLPGTGFHEKVKAELQTKQNWEHSNDLAMMYQATFSPEFYRQLHQHTHRVYQKEKLLKNFQNLSTKSLIKLSYLWFREKISYRKLIGLRSEAL